MIISRTPFRISFFGGGTDFPGFFHHGIQFQSGHFIIITKGIVGSVHQ